jgi:hypothetical protein
MSKSVYHNLLLLNDHVSLRNAIAAIKSTARHIKPVLRLRGRRAERHHKNVQDGRREANVTDFLFAD